MTDNTYREGGLEAPARNTIDWKAPEYYHEAALFDEMARVFDICHGCRRCVNLCHAFPTLFDLVDASATMEVDGVDTQDYARIAGHCYLCDLCYMTKCPYVPPHEWNVDFPHLMLRAKAVKHQQGDSKLRDRILTSTDAVGNLAGIPVVAELVNASTKNRPVRKLIEKVMGVHADAPVPEYHGKSLRKRLKHHEPLPVKAEAAASRIHGRVILFATCYGNRNAPVIGEDLVAVFEHNNIPIKLVERERCCGMPKLELGDLQAVEAAKEANIPVLAKLVDEGWDIIAPIPSCVLMFKQEFPLLFPGEAQVQKVKQAFYDPFEYLMWLHKVGRLHTDFKNSLGKIAYHAPCHQRVQNIGLKTRDVLQLVPDTTIEVIERCSGHDGTYAVKSETHALSMKICRPVARAIKKNEVDHYISDCPMAGAQIQHALGDSSRAESPYTLLRHAYGL
ncbi:MAG: heterodisulfide reductase-related iron-sulfur binding cluster [Gammaproteobacteria bacterium]